MRKGCLIAAAAVLALFAAVAVVVGPALVREGSRAIAPIRSMNAAQADFDRWARDHPWKEPAAPTLGEKQLTTFLALRKEVSRLDEELQRRPEEQFPDGRKPALKDVPGLLEGASGIVAQRTAAFQRAAMTPGEYAYVERLVYRTWLPALDAKGVDPAARGRAADEIEAVARVERDRAVAAGLRRVAAELRARPPAAPEGVPEELHRLLIAHAGEIQALAGSRTPRTHRRGGGLTIETN